MVKADSKQRYDLILESPAGVKLAAYAHPTEAASVTSTVNEASAPVVVSEEEIKAAASASKEAEPQGIWWIKARQGHSIKVCASKFALFSRINLFSAVQQTVQLDLKPIASVLDIPTGLAIHGTNGAAWAIIGVFTLQSQDSKSHCH